MKESAFGDLPIGDPGPSFLFEFPVYTRGAMAVHQLRLAVGDRDFFRILRGWAGTNVKGDAASNKGEDITWPWSAVEIHAMLWIAWFKA